MVNRFFRCVLTACLLVVGTGLSVPAVAAPTIDVSSARLGQHEDKTRFVLELSAAPQYDVFLLADPYRIVIDLPELNWLADENASRKKGLVENYRFGLFKKDTSRVVLDVGRPVKILRTVVLPPSSGKPYRFFIDIQETDDASFRQELAARRKQQQNTQVAILAPEPTPTSRKHTIVIDAGHGGIDPGAIGKSGVYEKKITLGVAKRMYDILSKNKKYNVILTRDDDTFLSLRERVSVGRHAAADLFVSIHADSIGRPNFRGAAVYTLSENASDDEAAELAKAENKSDLIAGVDMSVQDDTVQGILIDLAQRETMNFSVKFAEMIIPEIAKSGMQTRGRSHRFAGFRVLKAPDVPSVLVELGYLSNSEDEKILKSSSGQHRLAQAIANAIDRYFETVDP
ncbi:N-acetylmuramoyl-L-alanine amidase [Sneathiella sp. CAU 1612]|uniref:N-acetylmuramoyl-L-alanine amidase n=1 Tax=Sneathiella sedimenti TaxID=2816034 RepID=A0ABS3F916_9PROT|nr:N-acetylmuramoyl-L-alanine amidase [Sneathiella sedimenti]MBO0334869.1 N-acetylmuramoyl-L-alanine amidase [Sneathiella sedimenti]